MSKDFAKLSSVSLVIGSAQAFSLCLASMLFPAAVLAEGVSASSGIEFLGEAQISGTAQDLSGRAEALENGVPHDRFGGISALEYVGTGNRYIALPDRGPDGGATGYQCRYQIVEIAVNPQATSPVTVELKETHVLRDMKNRPFTGAAGAIHCTDNCAGRLDPEGIRILADGSMVVSDEYGPLVIAFDADGRENRRFTLPAHLGVQNASDSKEAEIQENKIGRVSNRGMEGLALSQDGKRLYGIMQSCLLQDGRRSADGKVVGRYSRLIEIEIATGDVREFAYEMDDALNGISEILACGPDQFLVLERDGERGEAAQHRRLIWIDLANATDITSVASLSADDLPAGISPVQKRTFLDFTKPEYRLAGKSMPEKIEGLTFGPKLADGRQTIVLAVDNDFEAAYPTVFWVFAIDGNQVASLR